MGRKKITKKEEIKKVELSSRTREAARSLTREAARSLTREAARSLTREAARSLNPGEIGEEAKKEEPKFELNTLNRPEEYNALLQEEIQQEERNVKLSSLLEVTPSLMSRVTGYSESTCKKVLYDVYPNKDITEFINQQMSIFLRRIKKVLYNVELWDAINGALEMRKIRSAEQVRLLVELQNINEILNHGGRQ